MNKLVCIMPVYNCADVILDTLKSIDGLVDEILCVDGRWIGMEGPDYSNDGTRDIILKFGITAKSQVFYITLPVSHQWKARTLSLSYLDEGDWAIMIDSDEMVVEWGDDVRATLENSTEKAYRMCWMKYRPNSAYLRYGVLRKTESLRWSTDHRRLYDKDGEIDIPNASIIHIVLANHPLSDKKTQRSNMDKYYKWLNDYENNQKS